MWERRLLDTTQGDRVIRDRLKLVEIHRRVRFVLVGAGNVASLP